MLVDRLKDLDCIGFIYGLPSAEQQPWIDWITRLRLADRLAETDPEALRMLRAFDYQDKRLHVANAWGRYLDALLDYHRPGLVIHTLVEYDEMLLRLSGPLLQLAPYMPENFLESAESFGALDQFYNNMRDMAEDGAQGMCWLPEDVLHEHAIAREDVIAGHAPEHPMWRGFMLHWIRGQSARLHKGAASFIRANKLPASLDAMRAWTLRRYDRISEALRAVDYDYRRFPPIYWGNVGRELAHHGVQMETA